MVKDESGVYDLILLDPDAPQKKMAFEFKRLAEKGASAVLIMTAKEEFR